MLHSLIVNRPSAQSADIGRVKMPFTTKSVLPVLPKPDHLVGPCQSRPLSAIEDKELRKKLRNRQSALAARERKKARMLELERKVAELQQSNKLLEEENLKLRRTLNEILRSATTTGVRGIPKNSTAITGTRYHLVKPEERADLHGTQGRDEPTSDPAATNEAITSRRVTSFIPGQLSNALISYKLSGSQTDDRQPTDHFGIRNETQAFIDEQSPIDYSMNGNRPGNRKNKLGTLCMETKAIKTEEAVQNPVVNALGRRQQDILRTLSMGNFYQNPTLNPTTEFVTVKKEAGDIVFTCPDNDRSGWSDKEVTFVSQAASENDSPFAQALKRSANAMLLSSKRFTSNKFANDNPAFGASPPKTPCKRKQALPSIDAVFNSHSKVTRMVNTAESEARSVENPSKKTCLEISSFGGAPGMVSPGILVISNREQQPLSLVKCSAESNISQGDPYLHQNSETTAANHCYDLQKPVSGIVDSNVGLLPSELSAIIENYSNSPITDSDDVLATIYDSSAGNSPLESVSSRDSGLGVDDDPLDWIPDASFFDFH